MIALRFLHRFQRFFEPSEVFPFFQGQIVGLEGVSRRFQAPDAEQLAGVLVQLLRLFLFALAARPFDILFITDFLPALFLFPRSA